MLYLEATTKTCSLKYVFLKNWQTRHTGYNYREDQHHHLSDPSSALVTELRCHHMY